MKKEQAKELWYVIRTYADAIGEVEGPGNSGEFHNEKEFQLSLTELDIYRDELIKVFTKTTGWCPVFIGSELHDLWQFNKVKL